jgi:hypothetical protein
MSKRKPYNLTAQQLKAVELIAYNDEGRAYKTIAQEVGITEQCLLRWRAQPDFVRAVNDIADSLMDAFLVDAYRDLRKLSRGAKSDGSKLKAIELILKNRGKLRDVKDITATVEDSRTTDDILTEVDALKERLGLASLE